MIERVVFLEEGGIDEFTKLKSGWSWTRSVKEEIGALT
jgi:hypothetical protein